MPANKKLLILPGDGIGPEVMREVRRVIDWMDRRRMVTFDVTEDLVGGAAIDARKTPIADATMQAAKDADAILFGLQFLLPGRDPISQLGCNRVTDFGEGLDGE